MVADDNDVGTRPIGRLHLLGGADTAPHDERDGYGGTDRSDDLFADRRVGSAARLEIDQRLAHEPSGDGGIDNAGNIGLRNGERAGDAHDGGLDPAIDQNIAHGDGLDARLLHGSSRTDLLAVQVVGIAAGKQRQKQQRIGSGRELRGGTRKKNNGQAGERTERAHKGIAPAARAAADKNIVGQGGACDG